MSSFNFMQDLLIENSKLRLENTKILQEFENIKKILDQIQHSIDIINNTPKVVERCVIASSSSPLPTQTQDFATENRPSLFIPTPDMDGLKDSISKVSKKKRKVNFDDAVSKLKDMENNPEQNK